MSQIAFDHIDWTSIEKIKLKGDKGYSIAQTIQYPGLRIRRVEYSTDYKADHWCQKGHIVHCLSGELMIELKTGEQISVKSNESFVVSDDASGHLTYSTNGASLIIIDGDFLQ